jgi:hypothetical protein
MPDFKTARAYAASQGWLIVQDNVLRLNHGGVSGGLTDRWAETMH